MIYLQDGGDSGGRVRERSKLGAQHGGTKQQYAENTEGKIYEAVSTIRYLFAKLKVSSECKRSEIKT